MKYVLLGLFILPLVGSAQNQKGPGFEITGTVKGVLENSTVFLTDVNNPPDTLALALVKMGTFVLKGQVPEPSICELNFESAKKRMPVFIGNDKIQVEGNIDELQGLKLTGSSSMDDFVEFQKIFTPYITKINMLGQLQSSAAGISKSDSISRVLTTTIGSAEVLLDQFIEPKKSSYVSPFVLMVFNDVSGDVLLQEKRLNSLSPQVQGGYFGKMLRELIENGKIGAVGTEEIDFTQNDTTGNPITLSSFKGKYVLVDFWASWCHPCRMDNPNVVATYSRFKNKNFTILGVSLDRARDPWVRAISEDNLSWAQVSDLKFWNNEVALKYKIRSIPQNFLVDPNGKIVGRNLHGPELQSKLCELIGCN
jgi:thiol-disulfide isomerase/thioredoxin